MRIYCLLCSTHVVKVKVALNISCYRYGYATNTKVKFVLITEAGATQGGDPEMRKVS